MAKWKRTKVGSVLKDKQWDDEGTPGYRKSYIKFNKDCSFSQNDCLSLESKKSQLDSLNDAVTNNKVSEEIGGEIRERIEKIPEFVLFEMIKVERVD